MMAVVIIDDQSSCPDDFVHFTAAFQLVSVLSQSLESLVEWVPACTAEATIREILQLLQRGQYPAIAIVTPQRHPFGVVFSQGVLEFLAHQPPAAIEQPLAIAHQSCLVQKRSPALMEPLVALPEHLSISDFVARHHGDEDSTIYGLLNESGQFSGLLNNDNLQQVILSAELSTAMGDPAQSEEENIFRSLSGLFPLLDSFPVPLMVKTSVGQILYQNPSWGQTFGKIGSTSLVSSLKKMASVSSASSVDPSIAQGAVPTEFDCLQEGLRSHLPLVSTRLMPEAGNRSVNSHHFSTNRFAPLFAQVTNHCRAASEINGNWQFLELPFLCGLGTTLGLPDRLQLRLVLATDRIPAPSCHQPTEESHSAITAIASLNMSINREFLMALSHDLRSPLTAIMGLTMLLQEQNVGPLNERQLHYVKSIAQNARELVQQANELLDPAQVDQGSGITLANGATSAPNSAIIESLPKPLTILYLHGNPEQTQWLTEETLRGSTTTKTTKTAQSYRIVEADSLEQAITLARLWHLDVVVLDEITDQPQIYLQTYSESEALAHLPLVILDATTAALANQFPSLSIFPYFPPSQGSNWDSLLRALQIATSSTQEL